MAKWVLLSGISVNNVVVPGTQAYRDMVEAEGLTVREEDDEVPVAPGWEYDAELEAYYDPQA